MERRSALFAQRLHLIGSRGPRHIYGFTALASVQRQEPPASWMSASRPSLSASCQSAPGQHQPSQIVPLSVPSEQALKGASFFPSRVLRKRGKSDSGDGERVGSRWGGAGSDRRHRHGRGDARAGAHANRGGADPLRGMRRRNTGSATPGAARRQNLHRVSVGAGSPSGDDRVQSPGQQRQPA